MTGGTGYLQFAMALVFVLALIGGLAAVARRLGYGHAVRGPRSRRLALVEVMSLDAKRRLVLIRRDQVEHLLLLGPGGEQVVESGIAATAERKDEAIPAFASHMTAASAASAGGLSCVAP